MNSFALLALLSIFIELLIELIVGPILEVLFEAIWYLIRKALRVTTRTAGRFAPVDYAMLLIAGIAGGAWGTHVGSTTDVALPRTSLVLAVFAVGGAIAARQDLRTPETWPAALTFGRSRWARLAAANSVAVITMVGAFRLAS